MMQTQLKILIVTDAWHPQVNGVVRTYEHLSKELGNLGHIVKIIGPSDFKHTLPMPSYPEIRLAALPYSPLKDMIEAFAPDYIHVATEGPLGWAARRYCLAKKRKFSTIYHTQFPQYLATRLSKYLPFAYKPVCMLATQFVRHFHAPSCCLFVATQTLEDELNREGFKTPKHRLSRGVRTELFTAETSPLLNGLKRPVALYVGRIAIEKNLEAFLKMDWDGDKVLVGEGPALEPLKKAYPEAIFKGKQEGAALVEHYRSADVFVFPSLTDTFGMVIIEALACGLPVAAYDVIGPRDIITEDYLGALDADLSKAAYKAIAHGTREQRAAHIARHYTWPAVAQQFLNGIKT